VVEVSLRASTILDTNRLLWEVANLTKERFNLYHAHIYLLNETEDTLNLVAGAGEVGQTMVAQGWQIPISRETSLVARAARSRQGVIVNDVRKSSDFLQNPLLAETQAEMAVPMIVGDKLLGVLDVQAKEIDRFTQEDIRIQTTLAAQIAVAVQNADRYSQREQLLNEAEDQARRLLLLNEMGAELNQAMTVEDVFRIAASKTTLIVGGSRASVALLTSTGDGLEIFALDGLKETIPIGTKLPMEGTQVGKVVQEKRLINTPDLEGSDFFENRQLAKQGLRSTLSVPLLAGGRVLGVLNVASPERDAYTPRAESLMLQIASILATTIESQRLFQQAQIRARRERILREVITHIRSAVDVDNVMRTAAQEVGRVLGRPVFVRLGDNTDGKQSKD
jgi:GAF domain-containing protein